MIVKTLVTKDSTGNEILFNCILFWTKPAKFEQTSSLATSFAYTFDFLRCHFCYIFHFDGLHLASGQPLKPRKTWVLIPFKKEKHIFL